MNVFQILTGTWNKKLKQNMDVEEVGKLDTKKYNPEEIKQIREDHDTIFPNEIFWEILKIAISVNVDSSIKK